MAISPPEDETVPLPAGGDDDGPPHIPDHELIRRVGRGSYGDVWLARNALGTYRAVKIVYRKSFKDERPYEREFTGILKFEPVSRSHPGMVAVLQVGRNDSDAYFYYVMELADDAAGQLKPRDRSEWEGLGEEVEESLITRARTEYIPRTLAYEFHSRQRLPVEECVRIGIAMSAALAHLHKQRLVHRDVKPSNIIFVNGTPKLADIGTVTDVGEAASYVGTQGFIPPEGPGTMTADIYSLGKVMYEISTGKDRQDYPELPTLLGDAGWGPELIELNEVILKACRTDPRERYQTAEKMHADLSLLQRGTSLKRLRKMERRLEVATKLGLGAVVVALLATGAYLGSFKQIQRANKAEMEARMHLREAYLGQARATRLGRRAGQRHASLEAVKKATELKGGMDARNEAIAALAVPDLKVVKRILYPAPILHRVHFDAGMKRYGFNDERGHVYVRSLEDHRELGHLPGDGRTVERWPSDFSPDGRYFSIYYQDRTFKVWDVDQNKIVVNGPVSNLSGAFSQDNRFFAASQTNGPAIVIYDLSTGHVVSRWEKGANFKRLAFSPDDKLLACVEADTSQISIFEVGSGKERLVIPPVDAILCFAWSGNGKLIAAGCQDQKVRVWETWTGKLRDTLGGFGDNLVSIGFNHAGTVLATSAWDNIIRLWSPQSGRQIVSYPGMSWRIQFSKDDRHLGLFSPGAVSLLELDWSKEYRRLGLDIWGRGFGVLDFSPDGKLVASAVDAGFRINDAGSGKEISEVRFSGWCHAVIFHPDGKRLIISEEGVGVSVHELEHGMEPGELKLGPAQLLYRGKDVRAAALDGKGERLAVAARSGNESIILNLKNPKEKKFLEGGPQSDYIAITPDGRWVATGHFQKKQVQIWNGGNGKLERTLEMPGPTRVEFSPDGKWLATSSTEYQLWEVGTWKRKNRSIQGHPTAHVSCITFSPDGRIIALGREGHIQLYEIATGKALATLEAPDANVLATLRFSADGSMLGGLERCREVQIWDLRQLRKQLSALNLDWNLPEYPRERLTKREVPAGVGIEGVAGL